MSQTPHFKRNVIGGVIGNVLEWYDFSVFGYFAPSIAVQFFPSQDHLASLVGAFGAFAAGYLIRPLGGMFFGSIGDRLGRKRALQLSIALMALPTIAVGALPDYSQIGAAAPILLVLLRMVQGVSVGGELISSISYATEIATRNRRGLYGSLPMCAALAGVLLGSVVATIMYYTFSDAQRHTWAWRIPFLAGLVVAGFGIWMRSGLSEVPEFKKHLDAGDIDKKPVATALQTQWRQIVHVSLLVMAMGCGFFMLFVWWPTYLMRFFPRPVPHAFAINTTSMVVLACLIPLMGLASDLWGRRIILALSTGGLAVFAYPLFVITDHGALIQVLACQLVFAVLVAGLEGAIAATMVEMFPMKIRCSGIAIGYNFSIAIFGGVTPMVSTWLVKQSGHDLAAPAYYLMAVSLVSFVAALFVNTESRAEAI